MATGTGTTEGGSGRPRPIAAARRRFGAQGRRAAVRRRLMALPEGWGTGPVPHRRAAADGRPVAGASVGVVRQRATRTPVPSARG